MILWILFAAITAAVALAIVRPFWRSGGVRPDFAHDIAVYKQQLTEIEEEAARGLLGKAEADAGRIEISRRILAASENSNGAKQGGAASAAAPYVLIMLLAVGTMALYLAYGSPGLRDQPLSARLSPENQPPIDVLVARVEERLRINPEDGAGWSVIGPVYMRLGRYPEAVEAFRKAAALLGDTPERRADLGEALIFAANGQVGPEARAIFEKLDAAEPGNFRAAFWLATAQEQAGQNEDAASRYRKLLESGLPENVLTAVRQRLAAVEARLSGKPSADAEQSAMIDGMVSGLADRLKNDGSDLEGWLKLVRAYTVLGRREEALGALKQAQSQFAGNSEALGQIEDLAKSLGLTS